MNEIVQINAIDGSILKIAKKRINEIDIKNHVTTLISSSYTQEQKCEFLKKAVQLIDLTTLEATDTDEVVKTLCSKAINAIPPSLQEQIGSLSTAAVCVYPIFVKTAVEELSDSNLSVASVATGFPSGQTPLHIKKLEVEYAVKAGASEIDMVISRGRFLAGDYQFIYDEIVEIKKSCGNAHLKVILETGELPSYSDIRLASDIAMHAGADFIKTSTGKISKAANLEVTLVMLEAITDFYSETEIKIGMKPAGGIRISEQAIDYITLLKNTVGDEWISPNLFRFGASSLLNDIVNTLKRDG